MKKIELTDQEIGIVVDALREYRDEHEIRKWNAKKGTIGHAIHKNAVIASKPLIEKFERLGDD